MELKKRQHTKEQKEELVQALLSRQIASNWVESITTKGKKAKTLFV